MIGLATTRSSRPAPARPRNGSASTTEAIASRITDAVIEHRLLPGAKLGEEALAEVFGVSRTKVRQALIRLAQEKLVTLQPARGAFVAKPDAREARELFDARRIMERVLIERFAASATREHLSALRDHMREEQAAIRSAATAARINLRYRDDGSINVAIDEATGRMVVPQGSVGFRWGEKGKWNLEEKEADGQATKLRLSLADVKDEFADVAFPYFGNREHDHFAGTNHPSVLMRKLPVKRVATKDGEVLVATVFDLFVANYGLNRGFGGEHVAKSYDDNVPYTPAWAERITGVPRDQIAEHVGQVAARVRVCALHRRISLHDKLE